MSDDMNNDDRAGRKPERPDEAARRPYERPGIISREVWEAVAAVCGGVGAKATRPPCTGPLAS